MKLILFGAPGSGKGSLASRIKADYNIPQISTGDILRDNIARNTEIGKNISEIMKRGELVSDELVISLVKERLSEEDCKNGFMLDGFPRNEFQAIELDKFVSIDQVIFIDVAFNEIEKRLTTRRVCPSCKAIYNTTNYFKDDCEECHTKLIQREDDKISTVRNRLTVYQNETEPLIKYYEKKGNMFTVIGQDTADMTYAIVKEQLEKMLNNKKKAK